MKENDASESRPPANWVEDANRIGDPAAKPKSTEGSRVDLAPASCQNLSFGVTLGTLPKGGREAFQFNDDRFRHTMVLGRTGAGKSNHLQQMERQDIRSGAGVFILAAHEDDALYPLSCVPEERLGDVVFLDMGNPEYLPRLNPLDVDQKDHTAVDRAMSDALELLTIDCHYEWAGPRFEQYLRNGIQLLLMDGQRGEHGLAELYDLYTNPEVVRELLKSCDNERVYDFWTKVYVDARKSSDGGEVTEWFLSKVSRFCTDATLEHVFGAGRTTVDIQNVIDEGKIFIAYVPESRVGSAAAKTIGKWLVMQLRDAIMNRKSRQQSWRGLNYGAYERGGYEPGSDLEPFFVYVDEFARFAGTDFEVLLAEARKQHVGFVLSTQTLSQTRALDKKTGREGNLEDAILGNVGSMVCYPMGSRDAAVLSWQFDVDSDRLVHIERYKPLARLCVDNQVMDPQTLEVGLRPKPDNPSAARRVALSHVLSGTWVEVEGNQSGGQFFKAVGVDGVEDRIDNAYRYRNPKSRLYEITTDLRKVETVVGDDYDIMLVHVSSGTINQIVSLSGREALAELEVKNTDHDGVGEEIDSSDDVGQPEHPANGLGHAYRYFDYEACEYRWTTNLVRARHMAGTDFDTVWVCYRDGMIDHPATEEEYLEELEVRIGFLIGEGLPEDKLDEFDAISDAIEAKQWIEENRPDYPDIIRATMNEMSKAIVLSRDQSDRLTHATDD